MSRTGLHQSQPIPRGLGLCTWTHLLGRRKNGCQEESPIRLGTGFRGQELGLPNRNARIVGARLGLGSSGGQGTVSFPQAPSNITTPSADVILLWFQGSRIPVAGSCVSVIKQPPPVLRDTGKPTRSSTSSTATTIAAGRASNAEGPAPWKPRLPR